MSSSRESRLLERNDLIPTNSRGERWLPVVGYEGIYEVSSLGRVRSLEREVQRNRSRNGAVGCVIRLRGKVLSPTANKKGYLHVSLWAEHRREERTVHTLVAEAFLPDRPPNTFACHKNGRPSDCRATNLYWGTAAENQADRKRHCTHIEGECSPVAKLKKRQVEDIRRLAGSMTQAALAELFHISQSHVSGIISGKFWKEDTAL